MAAPADGLRADARVCLYNHSALSHAAQLATAATHCFAAYDTVAIAGYCVPTPPRSQAEYDAAGVGVGGGEGRLLGEALPPPLTPPMIAAPRSAPLTRSDTW